LATTQIPIATEKAQIKAIDLVLTVESLVATITQGTEIANKIRETKSQTLPIEDRSETTKGKINIESTIRMVFLFDMDKGALFSFSAFFREGATALNISRNATISRTVVAKERALLISNMPNRNKNGVAFTTF
jgi:hypothetical protein